MSFLIPFPHPPFPSDFFGFGWPQITGVVLTGIVTGNMPTELHEIKSITKGINDSPISQHDARADEGDQLQPLRFLEALETIDDGHSIERDGGHDSIGHDRVDRGIADDPG